MFPSFILLVWINKAVNKIKLVHLIVHQLNITFEWFDGFSFYKKKTCKYLFIYGRK